MYAFIQNGQIIRALIDLPPELVSATVAEQEAAGYYAISGPARPVDDLVHGIYYDPSVSLNGNARPVVAWTQRAPMTPDTVRIVTGVNRDVALDLARFMSDVADIKAFLQDPDIQRVLDQPNNTALATADLNRALKALVRQARRNANLAIRISKVVVGEQHPETLLSDV